jgi:aquaporin Z
MHLGKRAIAEFLGTFWLTFGGCGSAVIAAAYPQLGIGFLGVALAFGLTVVTMAYAVGHISGAHFNPAITIGLWAGRRIPFRDVVPYVVFQVAGAIAAAAVLKIVAEGQPGFVLGSFASNGYGDLSPGHYNLLSCAIIETLLTFFFVLVIMGATSAGAPAGFAPLAIGLTLTLILLISISPHIHSGHQCLGQSRAQHRPGNLRRQSLCRSALVVLAGAGLRRRGGQPGGRRLIPQARVGT